MDFHYNTIQETFEWKYNALYAHPDSFNIFKKTIYMDGSNKT